jgi:hypothetical protein
MKVKNLPNTGDKKCKCQSWYAHWYNSSKYEKKNCSNLKCNRKVDDGAHVQKYNSTDKKHYIVPLCHKCNMSDKIIDIGTTHLAWANKLQTCEQ